MTPCLKLHLGIDVERLFVGEAGLGGHRQLLIDERAEGKADCIAPAGLILQVKESSDVIVFDDEEPAIG